MTIFDQVTDVYPEWDPDGRELVDDYDDALLQPGVPVGTAFTAVMRARKSRVCIIGRSGRRADEHILTGDKAT